MIDETGTQTTAAGTTGSGEGSADSVVAFCQQCGRALTASTRRQVGSGIYCEPCATVRQTQAAGWNPVNAAASSPLSGAAVTSEPNPALAGFLGLIPGVGAMYNGQYAKGVIHLVVFVVLVSLADNLNWVFWWFVWGWIFYQAFESYHTAQARRDGLPLPDPFGWNELGERLGFARNSPAPAPRPVRTSPAPPFTPAPATGIPSQPVQMTSVPGAFVGQGAPSMYPPPPPPPSASAAATPYGQVAYTPTFAGTPAVPFVPSNATSGSQRFPAGAVWLIALGVLFLLGNILPAWRITGRWLVPILLAAIALLLGGRRIAAFQETPSVALPGGGLPSVAGLLLGPAILLTLAVLLALQDAYWIPLRHSWPALLIVWGALLLIQRAQSPPVSAPIVPDTSASVGNAAPPSAS